MDISSDLKALFDSTQEQEHEKVASENVSEVDDLEPQEDDSLRKFAEDLHAGGEIFGTAVANTIIEKLAAAGIPAAGGGSMVPTQKPRSTWESVAARLAGMHGRSASVGDDTSHRAEGGGQPGAGKDTAITPPFKNTARYPG